MKKYPLEIENVGHDDYVVMSKGHHDPDQFMAAVRSAGYGWPLGKPEHRWVKSIPDSSGKFHSNYVFVDESVRGAWPATYSWEAYGEEQYVAQALAELN